MRVFLSWSGDSREIARLLHEWLPQVLHPLDPWMSHEDIEKGARAPSAIDAALESTTFGIVCVTRANQSSSWLSWEAGMLARDLTDSRVTPFLVDLNPSQLRGPLALLQATRATADDVRRLVFALNAALGDGNALPRERVEKSFRMWWTELERGLEELIKARPGLRRDDEDEDPTGATLQALTLNTQHVLTTVDRFSDQLEQLIRAGRAQTPPPDSTSPAFSRPDARPPLSETLAGKTGLRLLGQSLTQITQSEFEVLQDFVKRGGRLSAMLLDPTDPLVLDLATRSLYGIQSVEDLEGDIHAALECFHALNAAGGPGSVDVGLLNVVPPCSMVATEIGGIADELSVEIYPFKMSSTGRPHVRLTPAATWHRYFVHQLDELWSIAKPVTWPEELVGSHEEA